MWRGMADSGCDDGSGQGEDTFLYFAYGSNLLTERIHLRNPSATFCCVARLQVSVPRRVLRPRARGAHAQARAAAIASSGAGRAGNAAPPGEDASGFWGATSSGALTILCLTPGRQRRLRMP